jgi:hypothetical protein
MELAQTFFAPLSVHLSCAIAELPDTDLTAAHRVLVAMIAAMSTFESELVAQQPKSATARATATSDFTRNTESA